MVKHLSMIRRPQLLAVGVLVAAVFMPAAAHGQTLVAVDDVYGVPDGHAPGVLENDIDVDGDGLMATASNYASAVLADGPAHYYRLGESLNTDPAADEIGGSNGAYGLAVTLPVPGLLANSINGAAGFDGSADSFVDTGVTTQSGGPFSVEAWVNANAIGTAQHRIVAKDEIGVPGQFMLWFVNGELRFQVRNTSGAWIFAQAPTTPAAGTTFHVAGVFDGSDVILYVDGAEVDRIALGTAATNTNSLPITIGADSDPNNARDHIFDGTIDEVAIYDGALTALQIEAHFDARSLPEGGNPPVPNLAADGSFFYAPPGAAGDVDVFEYSACDADPALCSLTTVTITVVGAPANTPPFANDDFAETPKNTAVSFSVTDNDVDADGFIDVGSVVLTAGAATQRGGIVSVDSLGTVTFDPKKGFRGTDTFKYTVKDDDGAISNEATVTVNVVN